MVATGFYVLRNSKGTSMYLYIDISKSALEDLQDVVQPGFYNSKHVFAGLIQLDDFYYV